MKFEISLLCCLNIIFNMQVNHVSSEKNLTLELVQVLFRHGARSPVREELSVYNYANASAYEHYGIGSLTNEGKKQEYEFGLFLRDRYKNFLSANYSSDEVYAQSTNSERTKMSLQLVLAGLYPPVDDKIWNPELKWSPAPYSYIPHQFDILLRPFDRPQYRRLMKKAYESEEFVKRFAKYSEFLESVNNETGVDFDNIFKTACFFGTLVANENMKLPLPEWYTSKVKQSFINFMENVYYDSYAFTPEMKRLGPGFIIKAFIENMNLNRTNYNPRKIYLYSAHDDNLATFIRAHDIQDLRYPPYGSGVVFEKLKDSKNSIYIRILGWTGDGKISTLKIGNHEDICPIEDYLKIVDSFIPSDDETREILTEIATSMDLKNVFFSDPIVKKL